MSKLTRWTIGCVLPLCFAIATATYADISESATLANGSSLKTYRDVDGQTYFVLSLRPDMKQPQLEDRDILVLVDTSASQTGRYREEAIEAVKTIAAGVNENERINIMAIDLNVVPMTNGFVKGGEVKPALAKLNARTPLGATDLAEGLAAATKLFEDSRRARAIIYVGDGLSRANLIAPDELEPLVEKLVSNKVSVSSYAVGYQRDIPTLASIANNSGGSIFIDGANVTAQEAGLASLKLARGTVVWPNEVAWPSSVTEAFPLRMPPLRFDRDSILIGSMVGKEKLDLEVKVDVLGNQQPLKWSLEVEDATKNDDYAMIPQLVASARKTDGLTLTLLGSEGLDQARRMFQTSSAGLSKLGKQALSRGDEVGGVEMLREALRRDPGNQEAKALLKANTSVRPTSTKGVGRRDPVIRLAQVPDDLVPSPTTDIPTEVLPEVPTPVPADLVAEPAPLPVEVPVQSGGGVVEYGYGNGGYVDGGYVDSGAPLVLGGAESQSDRDLLLEAEEERELQESILRTEVTRALSLGRDTMRNDPASVLESLKNLRETIVQSPDISSEVRAELLDRLEVGLRQTSRAKIEKDRLDEVARSNLAELAARDRLLSAAARENDKIREYVKQVNALLDEGRFQLAEEVALQMREEAPRRVEPAIAVYKAGSLGNYRRMRDLFELNARRMADALYQVELSHVPFPDNPPIEYPPSDEWGQLTERRKARYSASDVADTDAAERRISAALQEQTKLEFSSTPLGSVMSILEERHNIPIEFNTSALEEESVDPSSDEVTIDVSNISLKSALKLLLTDLNLTYVIDNEVLMVTSKDDADATLVTKVYPVGDLVMPLNSMMMMGGMGGGMMGGMGGGMMGGGMGGGMMGGMGGGMGGGMMGGMGGGMGGGMMGGGMGGGMMGGGMFDVEDAIQLGKPVATKANNHGSKPAAKVTSVPAKDVVPQMITIVPKSSESIDAAWDRYFAKVWNADVTPVMEQQNFANVRETVRQLTAKKDFTQTIAMIQSALRHGQYQPWMHNTLAMALRANGSDRASIERAMLSTVDLTSNPDQVVLVAVSLSRLGLDHRAMQLYRDIATAFPMRPEPYMHALDAAKQLKDEEGIRWACENILAQAWPSKHQHIFDKAVRIAKAHMLDLKQAGKTAEAENLAAVLNDALTRDVIVRVTWTGEADIDLLVEEPSGTVCSLKNTRTSSGGVMLGDALPNPNVKTVDGISETYICPKGFDGEYRVLVKRIWGDVAAGKVNVEIVTNSKTNRQGTTVGQHISQQIDLREKDALLTFRLDQGRRAEQIEDHIVANAAIRHIAANQTILGQQFDRLEDERVAAANSLSNLRSLSARDPQAGARLQAALRGRGAVGFMPQLTVLPEGTMLLGQAVISADRRYVRVSMSPTFSRVADVQTFNFATGQARQQQNQGGGLGGGAGGAFGQGGVGGGAF